MSINIVVTRRRFLRRAIGVAGFGLLAGCAPLGQAPGAAPTSAPVAPAAPAAPAKPAAPISPAKPEASPAAVVAAPTASPEAKPGVKRGGTLTLLRTSEIRTFNPTFIDPGHYPFLRALYNTPVRYDQQLNPTPDLAEKFELSKDGLSVRLDLRKGVQFHSGRDLVSEDLAFTIQWYKDPKNTSPIRGMVDLVKKVETPDRSTVILGFEAPNPGVFDMLDLLFVVDKESVDKFANSANGTGPFKLAEYRPGEFARFTPFSGYYQQGRPYLAEYVVRSIPDAQSMAVQLETGAADVIWIPNYNDLVRLGKDDRFRTSPGAPGAFFWDIAVNTTTPNLSDKRVRQAISYAIDRERFTRTAMAGLVEPTSLAVPKNSWAYFPDLEGIHKRDVSKAKQLMSAAGKGSGFDVSLLTSSKRAAGMSELSQIVQNDLREIDIRVKIEDVEVAQYEQRHRPGDFELAVHSYGRANKDPGTLFTGAIAWFPRGSWTKIDDAGYEAMIKKAGSLVDRDQRKAEYRKLQEYVLDQSFTIPISEQPRAFAWRAHVKDFAVTLDNVPYIADVWLDK